MVPEQGHDWFPSRKVLMDIWREAPTDPIWDGKIYEQPSKTNIFTPKIRKEKHIRVYQVRHVHRRDSNETVTSSRVGPQSSGSTYTKEQNLKISNAKSSVVQWETGKFHPVPAPREHKLNTYQVRSLSPTPVVMSDGPSPLFDPPHTIDEKETTSIMKSHVIKTNNIPEHSMTMIWLNIWIYLTRKHNLLRNGQPWELEKMHGPGQAPLKIKRGKF